MGFPRRLSIIVPGGAVILVVGVLGAWGSKSSFFGHPGSSSALRYVVSVVLAPFFLLVPAMRSWAGEPASTPGHVSAVAVIAFATVPLHSIVLRRLWAALAILGMAACLFCEILIMAAPA